MSINNIINFPLQNYAMGKTRKVAWFVSNCNARNKRIEYARELSKYIEVDIFGRYETKNQNSNRKQKTKKDRSLMTMTSSIMNPIIY